MPKIEAFARLINHAMAVVDGRLYDCNMTRGQSKIEGFITL